MEKILIVDDSKMNREILTEMLDGEYEILEALDGSEAITLLQEYYAQISLVLLDMVMPNMNGLEVLEVMNKNGWLADIPVIMISSEDSDEVIHKAYELGVTEFIRRPFDALIVQKRCRNITALYTKQKKLMDLYADQFYEKEKNSRLMIDILAHIVEFRNNESGMHVINVQNYTEILLRELVKITDEYGLSETDITMISSVAALHDIGKISVPDEILNKPGKLTDEEFAIMKSHSAVGSQMLSELPFHRGEPIVKLAYAITRWHHERWDGRGYPDGLKGDDIPISAQVVSLADVYDALTSERVYKKAYSHETAIGMILKFECGMFNPILTRCLENCQEQMRAVKEGGVGLNTRSESDIKEFARTLLKNDTLYSSDRLLRMLEHEKTKNRFFEEITGGCSFEYNAASNLLSLSEKGAQMIGTDQTLINPLQNEDLEATFGQTALRRIAATLRSLSLEQPTAEFYLHQQLSDPSGKEQFKITTLIEKAPRDPDAPKFHTYKLICRVTESENGDGQPVVIGKLIPIEEKYGSM